MSKHTKGPVTAELGRTMYTITGIGYTGLAPGNRKFVEPPDDERAGNAALIAEAFNVAAETGRTPRQLAAERGKLLAVLRETRSWVADRCSGSLLKQVDAAIADAEGATP